MFFIQNLGTLIKKPPHPPSPKDLPIIGNLHQLDNSTLCPQLWQLSKKYDPLFSFQLGLRPAIVISSPKLAKEVPKNHDLEFCGRPKLLAQQKLSYNSSDIVFSPYNEYWREIRKVSVVHIFSSKRVNILAAGTDTTAATSVWAMTALVKNPRVMKKVQEEVRNVGGTKDFLDEDDIQKLPYFKAMIKETLRLHLPSQLLIPRESTEECIVDGYRIPAKTIVYVNAWVIQRDPEVWKNPEEFCPERFLDSAIDFRGQDFELIPFGAGRRICPGIPMAAVILELVLANLLHSFDWKLPQGMVKEDIDVEVLPGITQHKKNHLCLRAKTRSHILMLEGTSCDENN
ncbi:Cytochrome P450 71B37 [Glycine soja]|uniref:Cytochrome P450 71B37 n=2 Tax=Glycine soja TaxID=3848 RepID=A0A0B2S0Q5_GLYSO|nr:Cytochrome P450 71B37 [Glycine soja]